MASQNPPWLDALLAQAYPGNSSDMSMFPAVNSGDPRPDVNMQMGMVTPPTAGGYPVAGGDPRAVDAAMNMNTGMAPGSFGGTMVPRRPVAGPPRPNPSNVGGAPSPGIPAPLGANRTGNNLNPNYSLVQYGVGGGAQGPAMLRSTPQVISADPRTLVGGSKDSSRSKLSPNNREARSRRIRKVVEADSTSVACSRTSPMIYSIIRRSPR